MLHGYFDLPTFYFFEEGNIWSGSLYTNFNYRIVPKKAKKDSDEKSELKMAVWYGTKCFDMAEELVAQYSEDYSAEGLEACIAHLTKEFEHFKEIRKTLSFD
ncbi:hypothetical protein [uncultured Ruminococcus sp.]|uniref:hypothetical protein n=1 Tax=uncultured Ruminococcus sp. TaxID=165186 RepID=UPI0025FE6F4A|nr:hypothetical protein [uncultured Ruminococcus sp.]